MTSTTIHSTTGTAPIVLSRDRGLVRITLEDGSTQVYDPAELMAAVEAVSR